jgi:prepilin-type N-terminal cleavage/methylation domain-containing protein
MKSLKSNAHNRRHRAQGFSLLEMMIVLAIMMVIASIGFVSLQPSLKAQRVSNAYNTTLSALRQARENAISQRTSYIVTFTSIVAPPTNTIRVEPTVAFTGAQAAVTYSLPTDVAFTVVTGIPTSATATPDGFGVGATAIDFGYTASGTGAGGQSVLYFCPDGSAQNAVGGAGNCAGNWNGGVVYIARPGELLSSRAITVWGGTGRVRGWRLYDNGGTKQWSRQ